MATKFLLHSALVLMVLVGIEEASMPPSASVGWKIGSHCACWNTTEDGRQMEVECRCRGDRLLSVPLDLSSNVHRISVQDAGIQQLTSGGLEVYKDTLVDLTITNVPHLKSIEDGAFQDLTQLRTIYIYRAMSLKSIPPSVFRAHLPQLKILRIIHTGLTELPYLNELATNNILHMIDLENNQIRLLRSRSLHVKAEQVSLNYNALENVEAQAFHGSQLAKLSLRGNRHLTHIDEEAFVGIRHLRELDLSETSISALPTRGLQDLEVLRLEDVETMVVFPSVYHFEAIHEAHLTYPYHCCAFQFPETHDPEEHAKYKRFLVVMEKYCSKVETHTEADDTPYERHQSRRRRQSFHQFHTWPDSWGAASSLSHPNLSNIGQDLTERELMTEFDPYYIDQGFEHELDPGNADDSGGDDIGTFHPGTVSVSVSDLCGNQSSWVARRKRTVRCMPEPDAFSPCEDLMGGVWLRIGVWVVAIVGGFGNLAVLMVLVLSRGQRQGSPGIQGVGTRRGWAVQRLLMGQLAIADLGMAAYLVLLGAADMRSRGRYFNFALGWQHGWGCQVAGFLTVLASLLSLFTLTMLTAERWCAITYALTLSRRLSLTLAAKLGLLAWILSLLAATLPLIGVSGYHRTSICLPMDKRDTGDLVYLLFLLGADVLAFVLICACYLHIYLAVRGHNPSGAPRSDLQLAKKMALLVFTDFACWAPVAFFGLTAIAGYPLIGVSQAKILLVFFYPLNACCNPYLYAILTKQYRRELFALLSRYGFCVERAAKYKTGYYSTANTPPRNSSAPAVNHHQAARGSLQTQTTSCENLRLIKRKSSFATPPMTPTHREFIDSLPEDPLTGGYRLEEVGAKMDTRGSPHPIKNSYVKISMSCIQERMLVKALGASEGDIEDAAV